MPTTTTETDVFFTKSGKMVRIDALMHASLRIVYDGKELEIDPVSRLRDRTVDYSNLPKADYIFITHEHGDHFDRDAIATLKNDNTKLISNSRCINMLGFGTAMGNGDKTIIDSIAVDAVPAYNITEGHTQFHPKGRDNGYVLNLDGLRIYIAGDTEDIPEMDNLSDIDIAFLPCNQPYTMTTEQIVSAARRIKPRILFPYHYNQDFVNSLPQTLSGDGIEVRLRKFD
ncbi:MAG: MBL fold metallo-hydrolase [Prevotella sp.]|nr:MBL fold metallo-hydrolase [Prevotella sp.]